MTNVSLTSRQAHREQVVSGRATSQRERILECIRASAVPLTRRQIAELTGIAINAVTGRVNMMVECKLRRDGLTTEIGPPGMKKRYRALIRVAFEEHDCGSTAPSSEFLEPLMPAPVQQRLPWPATR